VQGVSVVQGAVQCLEIMIFLFSSLLFIRWISGENQGIILQNEHICRTMITTLQIQHVFVQNASDHYLTDILKGINLIYFICERFPTSLGLATTLVELICYDYCLLIF
jgi:hypothetical protein